jgi:uncharacterized protein
MEPSRRRFPSTEQNAGGLKKSMFNVRYKLPGGSNLIANTLSGAVDIIDGNMTALLDSMAPAHAYASLLVDRGYLVPASLNEKEMVSELYRKLAAASREASHCKCILIFSFECNLKCRYCWQQSAFSNEVRRAHHRIVPKMLPSIFRFIKMYQKRKGLTQKPVVQLFGGEPLLESNRKSIELVLKRCSAEGWTTSICTNGFNLPSYYDAISRYGVNEIQVTIDGPATIHNHRRRGSNFHRLISSVDHLLQLGGAAVKLRVNIDAENVSTIVPLANLIIDKVWYTHPHFYAYVAPLRDHFGSSYTLIDKRVAVLKRWLINVSRHPQLHVFDMRGWDGYMATRHLSSNNRFPYPKFRICDASDSQLVFQPNGDVYACQEIENSLEDRIGTFCPSITFNRGAEAKWQETGPTDLNECSSCFMLPVCGGFCRKLFVKSEDKIHFCKACKDSFKYGLLRFASKR